MVCCSMSGMLVECECTSWSARLSCVGCAVFNEFLVWFFKGLGVVLIVVFLLLHSLRAGEKACCESGWSEVDWVAVFCCVSVA